jgi:lipopolysaccharide/colanic/teichoic acid biosynthesis glycosyltransferase
LDESTWQTFRLRSFCPYGCRTGCQEQRSEPGWHEFLQHFLPALVNIVKGDLYFVGVPPRRSEAIKALAQDWQALYLQSKVGIVTESYVYYGDRATLDEQHAAEVFYSVRGGRRHDCRLLLGYLGRVLKGLP